MAAVSVAAETMASVPEPDPRGRELLEVVGDVASELHPDRARPTLTLDSDLTRDAGLDSLGRVELMLRVQERFGAVLAEEDAVGAATPRALLAAMGESSIAANGDARALVEAPAPADESPDSPPAGAATLVDVLDHRADRYPDTTHVTLLHGVTEEQRLSHAELRAVADRVAAGLRAHGLEPGDTVAIMLPTGFDFFFAFHGTLRAGGVPVPLYPPVRIEQIEDHARRLAAILDNAGCALFVADRNTRPAGRILRALVPGLQHTLTVDALRRHREPPDRVRRAGDDLAFLQYTSGTTGHPKGVMLTHANLLANIRAMGTAVAASPADRFVSWLPLYHDMGLIGACLATLYFGVELVLMSPLHFMARPERWLWAIHRHGATISAAPDFAYGLCASRVDDQRLEGLDLSSWRLAFNGAEAVSPRTVERFIERFKPCGFRPEVMTPVYGLAESSVGLAFPPLDRGVRIDRLRREAFERDGLAEPAEPDDAGALRFVGCGRALEGHEIRVAGTDATALPERREGRVQFRGPSSTAGYYRNRAATRDLFCDGWLETGDRGYLADGEIFLTGRTKDLIIRAGRNIHPEDVEAAVAEVDGIRKHGVAAFGVRGADDDRERLVVMAETRETEPEPRRALHRAASHAASAVLDGPPDDLVLVAPRTIPKTSSGKIRRTDCRAIYLRGPDTSGGRRGVLRQALGLARAGAAPVARRLPVAAGRIAFATWCWLLAIGLAIPGAALVTAIPHGRLRAGCARALARALIGLTGTPLTIEGGRAALHTPRMIVANHASYLDGLILRAVLPGRLFFVAKRELARRWTVRVFLRRIGVEFVERGDHRQGLADLERIRARVGHGEHVAVFPEGRLTAGAGLHEFHVGPFMVAVRTGLAVVPVAIRGSRRLLRGDSRIPRPARLAVVFGEPIAAPGNDWNAALALRERARAFVAAHCGEPDLAGDPRPMAPDNGAGPGLSRPDRRTGEC